MNTDYNMLPIDFNNPRSTIPRKEIDKQLIEEWLKTNKPTQCKSHKLSIFGTGGKLHPKPTQSERY